MRTEMFLCASIVAFALACTSSSSDGGDTPGIMISIAPVSGSVGQGGSLQMAVTVTRIGGFTGAATISVEGTPSGTQVSVQNMQTAHNVTSAMITVTAGAATPPGSSTLIVRAIATGVSDATASYTLTVSGVPGFSLTTDPAEGINIARLGNASGTINIVRTPGFSGIVDFTVSDAPDGLTLAPAPVSTGGNSVTFGFAASPIVIPGSYYVVLHGTSTGLPEQTATVNVVIGQAGTGNVAIDFSSCPGTSKAIWLATQDGSGPWVRATATGNVYHFNVNASTGSYAWVNAGSITSFSVHTYTRMRTTMLASTQSPCITSGKVINGTLANVPPGFQARVSMGGVNTTLNANGTFTLTDVKDGNQDLVVYERNPAAPGPADRMLIRRAQNLTTGADVGTLDMTGSESLAPVAVVFAGTGTLSGESPGYSVLLYSGTGVNGCQPSLLSNGGALASGAFTAYGVPLAKLDPGDFHQISFSATEADGLSGRLVSLSTHSISGASLALPPALPLITITQFGGSYLRLQASYARPSAYTSRVQFLYSSVGPSRDVSMMVDDEVFPTLATSMVLPDFAGVSGWNNSWAPAYSATGSWTASAFGQISNSCTEGALASIAYHGGVF